LALARQRATDRAPNSRLFQLLGDVLDLLLITGTAIATALRRNHDVAMFRITEQRADDRFVLKLEGRFSRAWVSELDACWRAATVAAGREPIWVDLSDVYLVDTAGQEQLARMHRAGVRFVTRGCLMSELVREIAECH
jgi:hypothetical protein